jgi:hypothetical protein
LAAIELYLIKAKTGTLPNELPTDLPQDPFSDNNFVYEKTADGFVLKCQGRDLSRDVVHEYAFKVN